MKKAIDDFNVYLKVFYAILINHFLQIKVWIQLISLKICRKIINNFLLIIVSNQTYGDDKSSLCRYLTEDEDIVVSAKIKSFTIKLKIINQWRDLINRQNLNTKD